MPTTSPNILPLRRPFLEKLDTSWRKRLIGRQSDGPGDHPARCTYFGTAFDVDLGDLVGYEIAIHRFEWREIKMMMGACRRMRPALFIDIGANIGLYACIISRHGLAPRTIAFEPDAENFARLTRNISLNGLVNRVETHQVAVGAVSGTATLHPSAHDNRGQSSIGTAPPGYREGSAYDVPVITLDQSISVVDCVLAVKMDVEGHEDEVLTGAERLFRRNGGYAQIEARNDALAEHLTARMAGLGWRFRDRYGLDLRFEKP